ncbi:MAG: iron-sulfur cluster biosynthesis family protein [Lactobacillales bacterium]|jgi:uncharacterized protein YqkB|nr:iron-sulfur cluster biosynthesis family protein [Lactobacillales bacterium]
MQLTFDEKTKTKLETLLSTGSTPTKILFDFDDGVGPLSKMGNCTINVHFRIVLVDDTANLKEYNAILDSNIGPLYFKDYSKMYMGENMIVSFNPTYGNNILKSETETLDQNAEILDYRGISF